MDPQILDYIKQSRQAGKTTEQIKNELLSLGLDAGIIEEMINYQDKTKPVFSSFTGRLIIKFIFAAKIFAYTLIASFIIILAIDLALVYYSSRAENVRPYLGPFLNPLIAKLSCNNIPYRCIMSNPLNFPGECDYNSIDYCKEIKLKFGFITENDCLELAQDLERSGRMNKRYKAIYRILNVAFNRQEAVCYAEFESKDKGDSEVSIYYEVWDVSTNKRLDLLLIKKSQDSNFDAYGNFSPSCREPDGGLMRYVVSSPKDFEEMEKKCAIEKESYYSLREQLFGLSQDQ